MNLFHIVGERGRGKNSKRREKSRNTWDKQRKKKKLKPVCSAQDTCSVKNFLLY